MKLDIPLMAFAYQISHWIPTALGRTALLPGKETTPWLYIRLIKGIGFGTYLEKQRIDTRPLQRIEHRIEIASHRCRIHLGILRLIDRLNPCSPEFPFRRFLSRRRYQKKQ